MLEQYPVTEYESGVYIRNYYFRIAFIDSVVKTNSNQFYTYTLENGDTPESLSMKFYNTDIYWYLFLLVNNIEDPFYEWLLTDEECRNYAKRVVEDKYSSLTGSVKTDKINEIYTSLVTQNSEYNILVPSDKIVGYLHDEFLKLAKTFKE